MEEKYSVELKCQNCKRVNYIRGIGMGQEVQEFLLSKNIFCSSCGCHIVKIKDKKEEAPVVEVKE